MAERPRRPSEPDAEIRQDGSNTGRSKSRPAELRTFRLVLEYDGRDFEGWQHQAGARPSRTVQGVLADELSALSEPQPELVLRGAGRTDAGVHAWAQVASATCATRLEADALARALNARLPGDLAVRECREVRVGWDALRAARGKHYRYQIWNGATRSPLRAARWLWVREPLDLAAMALAATAFVGRHDFAALQAAGSSVRTTVRRLDRVEVAGAAGDEIRIEAEGQGFLRHMVRNLAGSLIEIGRGRWPPGRAGEILASRDRGRAGPTAPAHGLVLVAVRDDGGD